MKPEQKVHYKAVSSPLTACRRLIFRNVTSLKRNVTCPQCKSILAGRA